LFLQSVELRIGLTRIPFGQYAAATFVFMIPGSAAYAWLGLPGAAHNR